MFLERRGRALTPRRIRATKKEGTMSRMDLDAAMKMTHFASRAQKGRMEIVHVAK